MNIIFKWKTGKIEIPVENITFFTSGKLKKLVALATENREEVVQAISEYLLITIDNLNPESKLDKAKIEAYEKLLFAVTGKKQTKQEKAILRIVKNAPPQFAGAIVERSGKQFFCDGFHLVRLSAPLDFKSAKDFLSAEKIIGDISAYNQRLDLPELKALKEGLALAKHGIESGHIHIIQKWRKKVYMYDFGYGLPAVEAAMLLDMLEALPGCSAFCAEKNGVVDKSNRIYFSAGEDDGILLPIRKEEEFEPAPEAVPAVEVVAVVPAAVEIAEPVEAAEIKPVPDVAAIVETMTAVYDELYEAECAEKPVDYSAAVDAFEAFVEAPENADLLAAIARYRGDYITSDREAAAFMIALERLSAAVPSVSSSGTESGIAVEGTSRTRPGKRRVTRLPARSIGVMKAPPGTFRRRTTKPFLPVLRSFCPSKSPRGSPSKISLQIGLY